MDFLYFVVPALLLIGGVLITWLALRRMRFLAAASYSRWRAITERILLLLVVAVPVATGAYSTYNAIAIHSSLSGYPPAGKLYVVHGHRMHLYCIGSGQPTIILESGLGQASDLGWGEFQTKLAGMTRVCSYDRAGTGWSEPKAGPRDVDQIVAELRGLLVQARITGPLVLMGHSYGGMYVRAYTARYRADVAGLVLIDSSTPFQEERFRALPEASEEHSLARRLTSVYAQYLLGLPRLEGLCGSRGVVLDTCNARFEIVRESLRMPQSSTEVARAGPFGDLPVLIFSRDPANVLSRLDSPKSSMDHEVLWNQMQEELKGLSTRSRRIIARKSGHGVWGDREDLVLSEVRSFLDQIRGRVPESANYGSTVVE